MPNDHAGRAVEREYDPDHWHDHGVWGLRWRTGDGEDDRTSELVILFDAILDARRGSDDVAHYLVAPAELVFTDVADLRIRLDGRLPGNLRAPLETPMIHTVERRLRETPGDDPFFDWRIAFEVPAEGEIGFGASGYMETVLAEPVPLVGRWVLTSDERSRLLGAAGRE
jgi:hypothetical protein